MKSGQSFLMSLNPRNRSGSRAAVFNRFLAPLFIMYFLMACNWFDGNGSSSTVEEEEAELSTPPTAEFTVSTQSGNAPLTVTFSDMSQQGTASISSWAWDFGDGNTSTAQNPEHTFTDAGTYDVSLQVTTADGSDSEMKASYIEVVEAEPTDAMLKAVAVDQDGVAITGLQVTSDVFQIENVSEEEKGVMVTMVPEAADGVVRISKEGYLDAFVFLEGTAGIAERRVTMIKRAEPIVIDGFSGGEFFGRDGAGVSIEQEALVRPDGSIASGDVNLYITPIDTSDELEVFGFPGSFFGATAVGEEQDQLFSYGVVDIVFEQNGEMLQLREGNLAVLTMPLYANTTVEDELLVDGDEIPLWYLDEDTGLWIHESNGSVIENPVAPMGFSLQATTSHFTAFNSDINPPGLGRGGSGGGGGSGGSRTCIVNIELVGAELDKTYQYDLRYFWPGRPSSSRPRPFVYDGSNITHNILRTFVVNATISDGEQEGSQNFSCGSGDQVDVTLVIGDQPPEFKNWDFRVEPVFERNSDGIHEVTQNRVYVGGYFIGADEVLITSQLLDTPLIIGRGIYRELIYTADDPSPATFTGQITNDFGTTEEVATINYIDSSLPIPGIVSAWHDAGGNGTNVSWINSQGADEIRIFHLGNDIEDLGFVVQRIENASDSGQIAIQQKLEGYLRIEYRNQYGEVEDYIRIGEGDCPPDSEICVPENQVD